MCSECFLGILNREDEEWKTVRPPPLGILQSVIQPPRSIGRSLVRSSQRTERQTSICSKGTPKKPSTLLILNSNPKDSRNLEDLLARLTVDTASEFLFENLNTLSEGDEGEGSNRESGRLRVFRVLGHDDSTGWVPRTLAVPITMIDWAYTRHGSPS